MKIMHKALLIKEETEWIEWFCLFFATVEHLSTTATRSTMATFFCPGWQSIPDYWLLIIKTSLQSMATSQQQQKRFWEILLS